MFVLSMSRVFILVHRLCSSRRSYLNDIVDHSTKTGCRPIGNSEKSKYLGQFDHLMV